MLIVWAPFTETSHLTTLYGGLEEVLAKVPQQVLTADALNQLREQLKLYLDEELAKLRADLAADGGAQ